MVDFIPSNKKQSALFWNYIWANYSALNKADILKK